MGICQSVTNIVRIAFDNDIDRMILSEGLPEGRFDFFARVSDTDWPFWQKPLQTELKLKLGVIGRLERRETDVLLLQYRNPNAGGLKPPGSLDGLRRSLNLSKYTTGNVTTNSLYERDQTISGLQDFLRVSFALPIIDQTGLTNKYDFLLKWNDAVPIHPNKEGIKQAVLDQLGLELVPGRALVEMLVVEKVN
ncbi:MAG: TIGR03435 family protein [Limisphaerales bacterium]